MLDDTADRQACLLNRAHQALALGAGIDYLGDPLQHRFAIEQEQSPANNQQKNDKKG